MVKLQPLIAKFDKTFSEEKTREYDLHIQLSQEGLSIAILANIPSKVIGLVSYGFQNISHDDELTDKLEEIVDQQFSWLGFAFARVRVLLVNEWATLVPDVIFTEESAPYYLHFTKPHQAKHRILHDHLSNASAVNVYYVSDILAAKLRKIWANAQIYHESTAYIESLHIQNKNLPTDQKAFVNVLHTSFELVHIKNGKLFFYNMFPFRSSEDFLYFLLSAFEQIGLNPEQTELVLSGLIDRSSGLFDLIYKFVRNPRFSKTSEKIQISHEIDIWPAHYLHTLYHLPLCEL